VQSIHSIAITPRMRAYLVACAVALAALSATAFAPAAAKAETTNYLALGDSITFGYTQEKFEINFPNEAPSYFEEGFDNFFNNSLKKETEVGKGSTIVNDACPGETSSGLVGENPALGGEATPEYAPCAYHFVDGFPLHNSLGKLSQLEEALSLLKEGAPAHPVKAITLGIGSNDELAAVAKCEAEVKEEFEKEGKSKYGETPEEAVQVCVIETAEEVTFPHILKNIGNIIGAIDSTGPGGGHYTGAIVLLGFYNPFSFVLPGSDVLQKALNEKLETEIVAHFPNVTFANPFPVFNKGKTEKAEKESICKYTEMCNPNVQKPGGKPAGEDGDIHPTLVGYKAFAKIVNEAWLANPAH
jgi:lysophospholipase L1-like esterase